jgi:hypothetical protein
MATFNTPIIPAADKDAANAFWLVAGMGGNAFTVGLVPADGPANATPTHYWASMQFERYFATAYAQFQLDFPNGVFLRHVGSSTSNYEYLEAQLAALNLKRYSTIV